MKNIINDISKALVIVISLIFISSCNSLQFKYSTLNHVASLDGIYNSRYTFKIDTLNEFQLRNKLRTDFQFRYDYAQYALSQPASFDWNNRLLDNRYHRYNRFNRYNRYNPYYGYGYSIYYWDRTDMWHDWVWGFTPYIWSPFVYDRWGYNNYGWNNYSPYDQWFYGNYQWNNWNRVPNYNRRNNTAYINGRRGQTNLRSTPTPIVRTGTAGNTLSIEEVAERLKIDKRLIKINNNNNDQTIRPYIRTPRSSESSNNGRRRGNGEIISPKPIIIKQPNTVQPRQVRGGQGSPVLQQTRTRVQSNSQRRDGSNRRQN